jgi:hypothetical protein
MAEGRHAEVLMMRGQCQALPCHVECGGMFGAHVVSQVGTPNDRHLFRWGTAIAQ